MKAIYNRNSKAWQRGEMAALADASGRARDNAATDVGDVWADMLWNGHVRCIWYAALALDGMVVPSLSWNAGKTAFIYLLPLHR